MDISGKIKAGYRKARQITEKHAKTFYFASHILPRDKKLASYAIYAICRLTDDAVDVESITDIDLIAERISLSYSNNDVDDHLVLAFRDTVKRYDIPKKLFNELIEGMKMDLTKKRYADFNELYIYCYRVAGVVGLMMNRILGGKGPDAEKYAEKLGIAMQLTNILRDIREDWQRGRLYLPKDEMLKLGVTEEMISSGATGKELIALLKLQIARARQYYRDASKGVLLIDGKSSRTVTLLMGKMYESILDDIEANGYNVLSRRAFVSFFKKLRILFAVLLRSWTIL